MNDLKAYLDLKTRHERLNKEASDATSRIAHLEKEIAQLRRKADDATHVAKEIGAAMKVMEEAAKEN